MTRIGGTPISISLNPEPVPMASFCRKSTRKRATSVICSRLVLPFFGFPFSSVAHLLVLLLNFLGMSIAANGFSIPYLVAMALGTAIYGFLGLLLLVFACPKICRRAVGISRDRGHLVGEFSPRLYVFQPRLVARAFGFRRRALPLVLGPHTPRPHDLAMADPRAHFWLDGRHLLSQWRFPFPATD